MEHIRTVSGVTRRRSLTVFAMLVAYVLAIPLPALATSCAHDTWADGASWGDNYWVGYNTGQTVSCDLNGRYTLGIQRINWVEGYRLSSPDGFYGSNTHQDVKSFQAFYGLTPDGLVGTNTWNKYKDRITYSHPNGGFAVYTTKKSGGTYYWAYQASNDRWYILSAPWESFSTSGP